jgi:AcrR family transcriptional regulator
MKPQYHHGDLRRALLEAARDALRSGSAAQLSIRELARTIGVSPNAPYRHFADRDDLFRALALAGYLEAAAALEGLGQNGSRAVGVVWGGLAESDPELVALMTTAGMADHPEVADGVERWFRAVVAAVAVDLGDSPPTDVIAQAATCWSVVHGMTALRRAGAFEGVLDLLPSYGRVAVQVTARA